MRLEQKEKELEFKVKAYFALVASEIFFLLQGIS